MAHVQVELLLLIFLGHLRLGRRDDVVERPARAELRSRRLQVVICLPVQVALLGGGAVADEEGARAVAAKPMDSASVQIDADEFPVPDFALRGPAAPGVHVLAGANVELSDVLPAGLVPGVDHDAGQVVFGNPRAQAVAEAGDRMSVLLPDRLVDLDLVLRFDGPSALNGGVSLGDYDSRVGDG